jgi:trimeric autotransporter adhesin
MKKIIFTLLLLPLFSIITKSQSVAINTDGSSANTSAILDVKSTEKGMLVPRMSKAQKLAITTPANGLLIYQNTPDSVGFYYYDGTNWIWLQNANAGWGIDGNNNINNTNFIGTINNTPLRFKVFNNNAGFIDSTSQNTALGYNALMASTANYNTAFGFDAGKALTTGFSNTIFGNKALLTLTSGAYNIAIGDSAMSNAVNANANTAVGYQALKGLEGQGLNTFNTAIGYRSQFAQTSAAPTFVASDNTSVGTFALENNVTGNRNVAIGRSAMRLTDSSSGNVAIGHAALFRNKRTDFSQNVAVGCFALNFDTTSNWNTAIGGDAMLGANNSSLNTVIGFRALRQITAGSENNALGVGAMEYKDTALSCVGIGRFALSGDLFNINLADTGSIAIGTRAGRYNNVSYNTFIGYESGIGNNGVLGMTGKEIVSIGAFSLRNLTSGSSNSSFGFKAMQQATTGNGNVAIGTRSLFNNTTGNYNVSIGDSAMYGSATSIGDRNIAIGAYALRNAVATTTNNVAIGDSTMQMLGNGGSNVALGSNALSKNVNGNRNIAIGLNAGYNETTSDKLYIENSNANKDNALIYGDFANDSLNLNAKVNVRDFTRLGTQASGAPAIKMKKMVITGPAANANQNYPFGGGLTDSKIIGVQVLLTYSGTSKIPPAYLDVAGYEYSFQVQFNGITILNKAGNSGNIANKPITILVTYEE